MRIHPQYRRRGFGKNMLAHAESMAPFKTMRLIIESENHPSIKLVESMGYRLEDKWRLYSMVPRNAKSTVRNVPDSSEITALVDFITYAVSCKSIPIEQDKYLQVIQ